MKSFNYEDWRRRYLRWMNNNQSRVMDIFRKQDRDHDGRITRQEFIEGILSSSRMNIFSPDLYSIFLYYLQYCWYFDYTTRVN